MSTEKGAVLVRIQELEDGRVRLCLNDLVAQAADDTLWAATGALAVKEYDRKILDDLTFGEQELADFGYAIIARLYGLYTRGEV